MLAVLKKELTDTLRDGRSVFSIFVFPFILYPAILFFMSWMQTKNDESAKALHVRVGVVGQEALPFVMQDLAKAPGVEPVALQATPEKFEDANVDAVLVIPPGTVASLAAGDSVHVLLLYKETEDSSTAAVDRVKPVLDEVRQALTLSWARSLGANTQTPPALVVEKKDISSKNEMGGYIAALLIPYILIFMVAAGAMHTAVDATTGEKERSTLETILSTSATRAELVLGKCLAVITAALTGAVTGILGLWIAFTVVANAFPEMQSRALKITISPDKLVLIFLALLPAAIFLSAVLVAIGCFARSMREGQTYATYVYMASVFLGLSSFAQATPPLSRFFIPILNTALLQREILTDSVQSLHAMAAIGVTSVAAAVMLVVAVRLFSNESVLFRT
jgi:sodium transport system permease protein